MMNFMNIGDNMYQLNALKLLLLSGMFCSTVVQADTIIVDSKINKVTVYQQQGVVERQAKVTLSAGEHMLRFPQLSNFLSANSVQFMSKGAKPLILLGVEAKKAEEDFTHDSDYQAAEKALKEAQSLVRDEEDALQIIQRQLDWLDKLESGVTSGDKAFSLEHIQQLQGYTHQSASQLFKERRTAETRLENHQKHLEKVQKRFDELTEQFAQRNTDIWLKVQVPQAGEYQLGLSYTNDNLVWQPSYQLYYDSQKQQIDLRTYAQLYQRSGEDWKDVQLVFSSGAPVRTDAAPETQPWIIDYYVPRPMPRVAAASMAMQESKVAEDGVMLEAAAVAPEPDIEISNVAALFALKGKVSIPTQVEKQAILLNESSQAVKSEYAYYAQHQDSVWVTIQGKNSEDYPLLAGELQTFYDGRFVGTGHLETLYPQQTFTQLMGQDQTITVKKSPLKRFSETNGVITKSQVVKFEQETVFSNARGESVEITIHHRVPSSAQKDIIVSVQQPSNITLDNVGRYEQKITLPAKQAVTIKQAFSVEYPKDKPISGL